MQPMVSMGAAVLFGLSIDGMIPHPLNLNQGLERRMVD